MEKIGATRAEELLWEGLGDFGLHDPQAHEVFDRCAAVVAGLFETAAPGIDLRVRELLARRLRQWRTHLPADPAKPGTRAIRTYDHPGLEGETDYNNDVAIWREACSVLDEALTLIDAGPKGGSEHFQDRLAEIEGRPRSEPEVDEVEEVIACLGDDAAAMLDENPEDERALNMQRAAELLTEMQPTSAEVKS